MLGYGVLTLLALIASVGASSRDRNALATLAGLTAASWVCFVASFAGYGPAVFINRTGLPVEHVDVWAVTDALLAAAALMLGWQRWWGWSLWALLVMQIACHVLYQYLGWAWSPYSMALDALYLGQLAVFIWAGGKPNVDRLLDSLRGIRTFLHTA